MCRTKRTCPKVTGSPANGHEPSHRHILPQQDDAEILPSTRPRVHGAKT